MQVVPFFSIFNSCNSPEFSQFVNQSNRFLFFTYKSSYDSAGREERFSVYSSRDTEIVLDFQNRVSDLSQNDDFFLFVVDSEISTSAFNALSDDSEFVVRLHTLINNFIEDDLVEMNKHRAVVEHIIRVAARRELNLFVSPSGLGVITDQSVERGLAL